MMTAYPRNLLDNTRLHDEAEKLHAAGFIDKEQLKEINTGLPALQSQRNPILNAGLFLFGCFLLNACNAFIYTFIWQAGLLTDDAWKVLMLIYTILGFAALEYVIRKRHYFHFGIDDAFLFVATIMLIGFVWTIEDFDHGIIYIAAFVAGAFCSYRYINGISSVIACLGTTGFIAYICMHSGEEGKSLLAFALMANAAGLYFVYLRLKKNVLAAIVWADCLRAIYIYSIILFYAAGNYMVVRVGNEELLDHTVEPGKDIPLAWIFYGFSIIVPLFYIYNGLRKRQRALLQAGIFTLAFGVFSIRYYHQILPVEWALIIAGSIIFAVAYYGIYKLKNNVSGITFKPDRFTNETDLLNTEAMVVAESFKVKEVKSNPDNDFFGGGQFGGGGAGEGY
jgi:hypothetical protein